GDTTVTITVPPGGSGRPGGDPVTTGSTPDDKGSTLRGEEGSQFSLPENILNAVPKDVKTLTVDCGDGKTETVDGTDWPSRMPKHVYADDNPTGPYRLTLSMAMPDGTTKTVSYPVGIRDVPPSFAEVGWRVESGRVVVAGALKDPGINDT